MKIFQALVFKDFYEYRNNYIKFITTILFMTSIPIVMFNFFGVSEFYFSDTEKFIEIIIIVYLALVFTETTLFQTRRYIRDGVFEKFFINDQLRKQYILFSKFFTNLFVTFLSLIILLICNSLISYFAENVIQISFNINLLYQLIFGCAIGTDLAFISSLLINDEKNIAVYLILLISLYFSYYKILEIMNIMNTIYEFLGLGLITLLLSMLVLYLLSQNKFIRK